MSQFVQSLCRLYSSNKIDKAQLEKLLESRKINKQEYDYIISAKKAV